MSSIVVTLSSQAETNAVETLQARAMRTHIKPGWEHWSLAGSHPRALHLLPLAAIPYTCRCAAVGADGAAWVRWSGLT